MIHHKSYNWLISWSHFQENRQVKQSNSPTETCLGQWNSELEKRWRMFSSLYLSPVRGTKEAGDRAINLTIHMIYQLSEKPESLRPEECLRWPFRLSKSIVGLVETLRFLQRPPYKPRILRFCQYFLLQFPNDPLTIRPSPCLEDRVWMRCRR